jgi:hypothetical protein
MYVCMYVCMYVYASTHRHMHAYVCTCLHIHLNYGGAQNSSTHTYIHACMHIYMLVPRHGMNHKRVCGGRRDGFGVYEYPEGSRYEGDWKEDKMVCGLCSRQIPRQCHVMHRVEGLGFSVIDMLWW